MGIKGLTQLLGDQAPGAIREDEIKNFFGRKIAIDASMSLYQFVIAIMGAGGGDASGFSAGLQDDQGETTSHLQGMFHRTIRLMTNGMKPVFVFDGKPPSMKKGELKKRIEAKEKAEADAAKAKEEGDDEALARFSKRTVRVTRKQNEEAKTLLRLMGVPVIEAPCEAEAQCAELAKGGLVYATGTEDMDALTLGTPVLLRHLTFSEARKMPIKEFHLDQCLQEMGVTMDQFIDLGILLGCDYVDRIPGIGPVKAFELIKRWKSIEEILKRLDKKKYKVPEEFIENYAAARELFRKPDVTPAAELKDQIVWNEPDEEGLVKFLCGEKAFSEDRVRSGIDKLKKCRAKSVQSRLTSYFGQPSVSVNAKKLAKEKASAKAARNAKRKGGASKSGSAGAARGSKAPRR